MRERIKDPRFVHMTQIFDLASVLENSTLLYVNNTVNISGVPSVNDQFNKVFMSCLFNRPDFNSLFDLFRWEFSRGYFNLPQIVGRLYKDDDTKFLKHYGVLQQREPSSFAAFRNRGANVANLIALLTSWNFRSSTNRVPGENPLIHYKFSGDVDTGLSAMNAMRTEANNFNAYSDYVTVTTDELLRTSFEFLTSSTYIESLGITDSSSPVSTSAVSVVNRNITVGWPLRINASITAPVITYGQLATDIEFDYTCNYFKSDQPANQPMGREIAGSVKISLSLVPQSYSKPVPDGAHHFSSWFTPNVTIDITQTLDRYRDNRSSYVWYNTGVFITTFENPAPGTTRYKEAKHLTIMPRTDRCDLGNVGRVTSVELSSLAARGVLPWLYNEPSSLNGSCKNKRLKAITASVEADLPDLYSGLVLSQNDAMNRSYEQLGVNMLETVSDMMEIKQLLNSFGTYGRFYKKLQTRSSTVPDLFDFLSDHTLLYNFGIAPSIGDAKAITNKAHSIRMRYKDPSPPAAFRGRHDFSYSDFEVTFRSKIVLKDQSLSSFLSMLLPVRAYGLLPSFQNVWNLVRFSFVADWFFNIDDRLEAIDNSAILLAFDVDYVVSSIKIVSEIPFSDYELYGFIPRNGMPLRYSYFCRMPSDTLLTYGPSRFDFFQSSGPSDLATAASFFYKIMR
jgi:hypothetical protein